MNLQKAIDKAKRLANESQLNYVVTFDGKEHHVALQKHIKGNYVKLITPAKNVAKLAKKTKKE
jgi:hypothetical protein